MIRLHQLISSGLGIGYVGKGGGTLAAMATCLVWYALQAGREPLVLGQLAITVALTLVGVWSANQVEPLWGKDDKKVVLDEIAGMCLTLIAVPVTWAAVVVGLGLFRFFDIVKPFYIRRLEKVNGGWGVMLDDVAAGVCANVVLHLLLYLNLF